jgi:hypothetical protein
MAQRQSCISVSPYQTNCSLLSRSCERARNLYVLYPAHGQPVPLSIWHVKNGFAVCAECGSGRRFVPFAQGDASFLGAAIRERRLYVLWDV